MKALQFAKVLREKQITEIIGRAYAHQPLDMLRAPGDVALNLPDRALQSVHIFVESLAGFGQAIAVGPTFEELAVECAFEAGDAAPDSRVILAEAPCGRRQFPRAGDREEVSKVVPIEVFAGHPLTSPWVAVNGETKKRLP
jgi:hypothetical protein